MLGRNQAKLCFEVDMALKSGESDLKSVFSAKLSFELVNSPFDLVSSIILARQTVGSLFKKSFLYVVSKITKQITILMVKSRIILYLFKVFHWLSKILWVWVIEKI
jgi:hypothetical protein